MKGLLAFFEGGPGGLKADESQRLALQTLEDFVMSDQERGVQVISGPAGSGKTFMMKALVQWMQALERPVVLLAPTGRAAKVLARTTRMRANTLHRQLYRPVEEALMPGRGLRVRFELKSMERDEPCVFVVDEASMMGNGSGGGEALIGDLLQQVYDSSSWHKIILVGDPYQLPPVGEIDSPAFRPETWSPWGCTFGRIPLEGRYRQGADSPVLDLASKILEWMRESATAPSSRWWDAFSDWVEEYAAGGSEEDPRLLRG
jgi:exodeoxyribonuclease-5